MRSPIQLLVVLAILSALVSDPLDALDAFPQSAQDTLAKVATIPTGDLCTDGAAVDDGTYEDGFPVPVLAIGTESILVQRLVPSSYPAQLTKACICWRVSGSGGGHLAYDVVAYTDGPIPGSLVGAVSTDSGTLLGGSTTFVGTSCVPMNAIVQSGGIYVGVRAVRSNNVDFFTCGDTSPGTPIAEMFSSTNAGNSWTRFNQTWSQVRALGIRSTFGAPGVGCLASDTTLCLHNGRFKVEATYTTNSSGSGAARFVKLTDDTGYAWFFAATNVEMVVKVLDACGVNQRFWVFAGGLTDQGVTFVVTDTLRGVTKTYSNTLGHIWQTITDTNALASCP